MSNIPEGVKELIQSTCIKKSCEFMITSMKRKGKSTDMLVKCMTCGEKFATSYINIKP